ncbi:hypothetical protein LTR53_009416 [Teratosphaeriaceae sp. CCFEE 6253]|nr:hypothetical protein LTR53_009416 [Teratosphaeriaceae sp. CCFEE 6253]
MPGSRELRNLRIDGNAALQDPSRTPAQAAGRSYYYRGTWYAHSDSAQDDLWEAEGLGLTQHAAPSPEELGDEIVVAGRRARSPPPPSPSSGSETSDVDMVDNNEELTRAPQQQTLPTPPPTSTANRTVDLDMADQDTDDEVEPGCNDPRVADQVLQHAAAELCQGAHHGPGRIYTCDACRTALMFFATPRHRDAARYGANAVFCDECGDAAPDADEAVECRCRDVPLCTVCLVHTLDGLATARQALPSNRQVCVNCPNVLHGGEKTSECGLCRGLKACNRTVLVIECKRILPT